MKELTNVDKFDNITRIEYQNQLVLTTAQLAEFYECSQKQIRQNYANNSNRFIEEKHMFTLRGLELKNFKRYVSESQNNEVENFDVAKNAFFIDIANTINTLYLWTKRGAARHAKMLSTDKAWEVFERLEDAYFNNQVPRRVKGECSVADFKRAEALRKLAAHAEDPTMKKRLVVEAANLLKGEEIFSLI